MARGIANLSVAAVAACLVACGGQPLEPWHTERLTEEFDAGMRGDEVKDFEAYLALEDRLFDELRQTVYSEVGTGPEYALVRYSAGSASDPGTRERDYNRTFELEAAAPRGGILLLHGMSDSPYSLHEIGETLNEHGYWVIGLRLPGHGTAPSALKSVRWPDMAAAAGLAMERLVDKVGERPIHVFGYSTGAALALDLTLAALDDPEQRLPQSLVMISPAVGISAAAALAGTKATIGRAPGLTRFGYTAIMAEFDPFKYNSFTANAGSQVHRLTRSVSSRIAALAQTDRATRFPPILVFKSTVDATVSTQAVVDRLLRPLPENGNKLVLFDINRAAAYSVLLVSDPGPLTNRLMADTSLPFGIWLIHNENPESRSVVASYKPPFAADTATTVDLGIVWPRGVVSLSHVALSFSPEDPLYGRFPPDDRNVLFLGEAALRGERGLHRIPSDWMLRLRYNPFYSVLETRVLEWLDTTEPPR